MSLYFKEVEKGEGDTPELKEGVGISKYPLMSVMNEKRDTNV